LGHLNPLVGLSTLELLEDLEKGVLRNLLICKKSFLAGQAFPRLFTSL
jgi:hypothetical protein